MSSTLRLAASGLLALCLTVAGLAQEPPQGDPFQVPDDPTDSRFPERPREEGQPQQDQQEPKEPSQPTFRTGIDFVRVDVIVTDNKGNPVTTLQQSDFEITEDGKPQKIESFKLVKLTGIPEKGAEPARPVRPGFTEENEAAREDVRIFVFFLDDYHVRLGASMSVREPLTRFMQQLGPLDMVAVMYPLTPIFDVSLTRNHQAIANAFERFQGRKYDYTPRNQFEEKYALYPAAVVEKVRNQVSLSALKALSIHLGGLREGRKSIILVSEGYSNSLPPQMRDPIAAIPGFDNPNRNNPLAGENDPREDSIKFFNEMDILSDLREVYDAANRANTSIYSLDPRGLTAFEFDINEGVGTRTDSAQLASTQDTLRVLADETDGRAIVNRNDLEGGLRQVIRDSSAYYLLGYNSTEAPSDGKFHEIKVRVKQPGTQVRARKGYWALSADDSARVLAPPKPGPPPAVNAAFSSIAEPLRGRSVRTWIGTERGDNGKTKVTFVWEPVPATPGVRREEPAKVSLTAIGLDGSPYYRGDLSGTAPAGDGAAAPASPVRAAFDVAPGRLQLKMSVENRTGQMLDSSVQEIVIPDFTTPDVAISTPVVIRARNALELRRVATDPQALPTATRDFRRTDRLLIRFAAYGPGTETPTATARLLNRGGQPMSDLPVQAVQGSNGSHQVDLPLSSLPTGEYLVELKVGATGGEVKELVAFKVGS